MPVTPPSASGVEIWYTTDGDPTADPLLLIMGLSSQHVEWDEEFVALLVDRGYFVIRPDNRDVGLSSKPVPDDFPAITQLMSVVSGGQVNAPYLVSDMAGDMVAVLDDLGLPSAHVVGTSMGGMIAQALAIDHPVRVRTLTSIMSTTGDRTVGQQDPSVWGPLMAPPPATREEAMERSVVVRTVIGSPGLVDEERVRAKAGRAWDRNVYPMGVVHQILAIVASPDRTAALGGVRAPTLVIHGEVDPLINVSGGRATAAAIPRAELLVIEGMGHDLPRIHWPTIVGGIDALASRVAVGE